MAWIRVGSLISCVNFRFSKLFLSLTEDLSSQFLLQSKNNQFIFTWKSINSGNQTVRAFNWGRERSIYISNIFILVKNYFNKEVFKMHWINCRDSYHRCQVRGNICSYTSTSGASILYLNETVFKFDFIVRDFVTKPCFRKSNNMGIMLNHPYTE